MSAGEWIAHDGKGMPVAGDVMVLCRFADGTDEELDGLEPLNASFWNGNDPNDSNWIAGTVVKSHEITHYKVVASD